MASLAGAGDEGVLEQKRLDHIFQRVAFLAHCGGDGFDGGKARAPLAPESSGTPRSRGSDLARRASGKTFLEYRPPFVPEQAAVIRRIADGLLAGESLRSLTAALKAVHASAKVNLMQIGVPGQL